MAASQEAAAVAASQEAAAVAGLVSPSSGRQKIGKQLLSVAVGYKGQVVEQPIDIHIHIHIPIHIHMHIPIPTRGR